MSITTTPPRVLTMDDYEAEWKPRGWNMIIIGPTSTWRQDWGEWEAIRDIVQNALDECEHYTSGYDDEGFYIRDTGKGIAVADFLLGPPKLKPDYARGKYGEGMKIAALALLRLGYSIKVETKDQALWIVFLEQDANVRVKTLAALWKPNGRTSGTCFHIGGYRGTDFKDRFAVNLPDRSIITEGPSLITQPVRRFNQLIRHDFAPDNADIGQSRIYARDIYMRDFNSPYSYNLWSFDMAPDRHGPKNEADLWVDVGRLWCCVTRVEHIRKFLEMVKQPPVIESEESHNINMSSWEMGFDPITRKEYAEFLKDNASVWRQGWREVMGENAVIRTESRWDG
ncbi:MAG: hypothetical protein JW712_00015, partial [Dehalococcoidales bacterium]|nr:hypothetical protein [Dehalococcoidales bacterium]